MLTPSQFAQWTGLMQKFAADLGIPVDQDAQRRDPMELVTELNTAVYRAIA